LEAEHGHRLATVRTTVWSIPPGGIWQVSFMNYDLGFVDLEEKTLQPLQNPFGPKLYFSGTDNGKGWLWGGFDHRPFGYEPKESRNATIQDAGGWLPKVL